MPIRSSAFAFLLLDLLAACDGAGTSGASASPKPGSQGIPSSKPALDVDASRATAPRLSARAAEVTRVRLSQVDMASHHEVELLFTASEAHRRITVDGLDQPARKIPFDRAALGEVLATLERLDIASLSETTGQVTRQCQAWRIDVAAGEDELLAGELTECGKERFGTISPALPEAFAELAQLFERSAGAAE